MVQEYERAVIFRLGRLMQGGAKGPGKYSNAAFFIQFQQKNTKTNFSHCKLITENQPPQQQHTHTLSPTTKYKNN